MGVIVTMALGDKVWGQLALNLCLSIKSNEYSQKVALIYEESAVEEIKPLLSMFDYLIQIPTTEDDLAHERAFKLKTKLYDIVNQSIHDVQQFIFIDADCIATHKSPPSKWFKQLDGTHFSMWNNGSYNFETKERIGNGYTFWFDVEKADYQKGIIPQTNSSFIYFEKHRTAKLIFHTAEAIMYSHLIGVKLYKGAIPDEYCFNVAMLQHEHLPHEVPYKPIFFQFANEYQNVNHILHHYDMMGFAGEHLFSKWFVHLYNELAHYYREYFGVRSWRYDLHEKILDKNPIKLNTTISTLTKEGELPNSNGGAFNPDGKILDGKLVTVIRKEKNLDAYKKTYQHNTAIACFYQDIDVEPILDYRVEDFRLFLWRGELWCNFSCVGDNRTWISISQAVPIERMFTAIEEIDLPIKTNKIEKNWCFFEHNGSLYCVYSLHPYLLFIFNKSYWTQVVVKSAIKDWFHVGHTICNSTNPIDIGEYYLMLFHTKESGIYFHGAALIDKETLAIKYYTKNSIHIMDGAKGLHDNLIYISGSVYLERQQIIRLYFGAADSHAMQIDFNKTELVDAIINNDTNRKK